ncbi:hypothetical protein VW23_013315 [Devosia insulae DS-56]|uniref:DUF1365 domain-containing protein n=1 Tax=Devosia insulae DS-56 TaxID=1116389 RepID=A0A1E5XU26_9HYPH|nr:DUF1365 domain-containing protein [Devosia insulae]OEO32066.1 hypothetical protein VW23_013315 [Devosia insulae DS-56]
MRSALYRGEVAHSRLRPKRHSLGYKVFCLLLDLDELEALNGRFPLLGIERGGLFSFRQSDHGDGQTSLKAWAAARLAEAGIGYDGGRVELLCYPRLLGFVFNPLSVYFCHQRDGRLAGILYEVHNTHGERHTYALPASGDERVVRHAASKQFFVSPFMPMECTYRFRITAPRERVGISILEDDAEGLLLTASFTGRREELSNRALWRAFAGYPLMTLKVVLGIHWEALKLIAKGVPIFHWSPARQRIASGTVPVSDRRVPEQVE